MAKIRREEAIDEALRLLNDVGLDGVTTRALAQRLGVESATLYWHFKNKNALLQEMSTAVLARHHIASVPTSKRRWKNWLAENARSFRRALLSSRDGARLHAGTVPNAEQINHIAMKIGYLINVGFTREDAAMILYSLSQFTLGCVLEEQAEMNRSAPRKEKDDYGTSLSSAALDLITTIDKPTGEASFEFGLNLLLNGIYINTEPR